MKDIPTIVYKVERGCDVNVKFMKKTESEYLFQDEGFRISDRGIELIRNKLKYRHIHFSEIKNIEIKRGSYVNNKYLLILIGLALIFCSLFLISMSLQNVVSLQNLLSYWGANVSGLLIIFFLFSFAAYVLYNALIVCQCLYIETDKKKYRLTLRTIEEERKSNVFKEYLETTMKNGQ